MAIVFEQRSNLGPNRGITIFPRRFDPCRGVNERRIRTNSSRATVTASFFVRFFDALYTAERRYFKQFISCRQGPGIELRHNVCPEYGVYRDQNFGY